MLIDDYEDSFFKQETVIYEGGTCVSQGKRSIKGTLTSDMLERHALARGNQLSC